MSVLIWGVRSPLETLPLRYSEKLPPRELLPSTVGALWIPATTPYSIREGDRGAHAYAVQQALAKLGWTLTPDGVFGPQTQLVVKSFQSNNRLTADGIFGPASSKRVAELVIAKQPRTTPDGMIGGLVEGESGNLIAAVNWSVVGGVDCGYTQRRLYTADYGVVEAIQRAFNSNYQIGLLRQRLVSNYSIFLARPAVHSQERAWRLAVLNHNYPSGADRLSRTEESALSSYWTTAQTWVVNIGARFPDGTAIRTPLQWCQHYALGNPAHADPGFMVRQVTSWSF